MMVKLSFYFLKEKGSRNWKILWEYFEKKKRRRNKRKRGA
jgi:hypothetical protein